MQVGRVVLGTGYQPTTTSSPFPTPPTGGSSGVKPPTPINTAAAWEIRARAYELAMRGDDMADAEVMERAEAIYNWLIGAPSKPLSDRHAITD